MPQDAFHIRRLARELNTSLAGGKVNRISQVSKDELTFIIYTGKSTVKLILSANASGARVCLSKTEKEPLPVAPNFCMLLRKHLQNAEILAVRQYEFERIIEIDLLCTTDFSESKRTLHCELMGKYSNILLTEKGIILGALKTSSLEDNAHRVLFAGAKYLYPAPQDKLSYSDGAGMRSRLRNYLVNRPEGVDSETLSSWLFENVSGLALATAREIIRRATANGSVDELLSSTSRKPLWEFLREFCETQPCQPCVKEKEGLPVDFFAFPVEGGRTVASLNEAEDEFFSRREGKKGFEDKKRKLETAVRSLHKKQAKKIQEGLERLKEAENAENYRVQGELLTANLYRIRKGDAFVELENWYSAENEKIKISLDPTLSPSKNAQKLFKIYNKRKRAKEFLTPILEKERAELTYIESVLSFLRVAEQAEDLKEIETEMTEMGLLRATTAKAGGKRKETEIPFRVFSVDGVTVLSGRNNLQNDRLLRQASPDDVWLHAQKYHSSHVLILTQGGQVRDETLLFAAEICAYYSDGREGDKIPVDYCKRKFVKKPNKSKAGFVVYTDYKTVLATPNAHKESERLKES